MNGNQENVLRINCSKTAQKQLQIYSQYVHAGKEGENFSSLKTSLKANKYLINFTCHLHQQSS